VRTIAFLKGVARLRGTKSNDLSTDVESYLDDDSHCGNVELKELQCGGVLVQSRAFFHEVSSPS
jgi:hypothetical protein